MMAKAFVVLSGQATAIAAALDDAIAALSVLDAERLETIQRTMSAASAVANSVFSVDGPAREIELREVMERHRLLGQLLASTSLNLNVLQGLHRRNTLGGESWAR